MHAALERLLKNKPIKVKARGKLTPNKVNNEAGLGNSYIHKFPEFMADAKPLIDDYNEKRENQSPEEQTLFSNDLSEIDKLRHKKIGRSLLRSNTSRNAMMLLLLGSN